MPLVDDPSTSDGLVLSDDHLSQMLPSDAAPTARMPIERIQELFEEIMGKQMKRNPRHRFDLLDVDDFLSRVLISLTLVNAATHKRVEKRHSLAWRDAIGGDTTLLRNTAPDGCGSVKRPFFGHVMVPELSSLHGGSAFKIRASIIGFKHGERKVVYAYTDPFYVISKAKVAKSKYKA